ncbi:hypothetical protein SAMN04489761_0566 [Tenacibaculum sp. MAR_2009_124]|uniref:hypothetical protein n=1 Tax=Tenacibaculum sp. MAR_2009_124 TaxID=1250059 RepID=UPI000897DB0A|nr:hypothetical protein [Tenacibaculum sp. MAR_2009_124]SEB41451.1 hypothetical protein SAMN04489761_0566 [Tenacibaculum sp. MAR_2009_124]
MRPLPQIILFIFLVLVISCGTVKTLTTQEKTQLNKVIDSMHFLDQKHRHNLIAVDSKYKVDRKNNGGKFLTQKAKRKKLGDNYKNYQKSKDSIKSLVDKTNESNTLLLLDLTKKHGFPSRERLKVYKSSAYFIFIHSPKKYYSSIKEVISKEYKEKRISEYEKAYIFWHINGRGGTPPRLGKDGTILLAKPHQ